MAIRNDEKLIEDLLKVYKMIESCGRRIDARSKLGTIINGIRKGLKDNENNRN